MDAAKNGERDTTRLRDAGLAALSIGDSKRTEPTAN
jgi:hypothetical protein